MAEGGLGERHDHHGQGRQEGSLAGLHVGKPQRLRHVAQDAPRADLHAGSEAHPVHVLRDEGQEGQECDAKSDRGHCLLTVAVLEQFHQREVGAATEGHEHQGDPWKPLGQIHAVKDPAQEGKTWWAVGNSRGPRAASIGIARCVRRLCHGCATKPERCQEREQPIWPLLRRRKGTRLAAWKVTALECRVVQRFSGLELRPPIARSALLGLGLRDAHEGTVQSEAARQGREHGRRPQTPHPVEPCRHPTPRSICRQNGGHGA
mmetsp:Transcript_86875/g.274260  ORF Transcript_86875/g.274260 Transcript_86875/m.274260 type:complete len:262 (+) Transcript_86875:752-1537(+)